MPKESALSETDSFIEEVTEEVRRDRLFALIRRYGWIAVLVVLLIVGGAAFNEYRKAQVRNQAEGLGDAVLAAMDADDAAAALGEIADPGAAQPVVSLLKSAFALEAEDAGAAIAALAEIEGDADAPVLYRQLATLKRVMLTAESTDPDARIDALTPLTAAGAPFRVLAEEQIAWAEVEKGDTDAAIARLRALLEDTEASQGLRQRATQLIVALGGDADLS